MSLAENEPQKRIEILECTLRDGSYPVDFKFTLQDTALLTELFAEIGFKYIEVGHGVGLGAARAGKGQPPWPDEEAVRVAKSTMGARSSVGVFCIVGIATFDDMKKSADAGLDFIRIGQNAPEMYTAIPYVKEALRLGLTPWVNFMKSYAITPEDLGEKAKMIAYEGAETVCVVDSAGGMFPDQLAGYFDEIRNRVDVKMGFHAHNNLHLAIANGITAAKHGATIIDGTLYGLGRSAGNAPTEVLVAALENLGYETGIDLFRVMDVAEAYMKPLMGQMQMYDMMAVTAGHSLFHSSFLPKVKEMAKKHGVELRRLVDAMGKADQVNCPDDVLADIARKLARKKTKLEGRKETLISFSAPGISPQRISNTMKAAETLINGLVVSSAKRQCEAVLDLVSTHEPEDGTVLADFLMDDNDAAIGRILFGSQEILEDALLLAKDKIGRLMVDMDASKWISPLQISRTVEDIWGTDSVYPYSSTLLERQHLLDIIGCAAGQYGRESILLVGSDKRVDRLLPEIGELFERVMVQDEAKIPQAQMQAEKILRMPATEAELRNMNINANIVLCGSFTSNISVGELLRMVRPDGVFISISRFVGIDLAKFSERAGIPIVSVDFADAYRGLIYRISHIESAMSHSRVHFDSRGRGQDARSAGI